MKKTKLLFTVLSYILIIGFSVLVTYKVTKNSYISSEDNKTSQNTTETTPAPEVVDENQRRSIGKRDKNTGECLDFYKRTNGELSLYALPDFVKTNETAVNMLKKDCQMVYQIGNFDVTGDGIKDILLITEAIDCVTCRATSLIIISNNEIILDKQVSNAMIRPVSSNPNAFELKEPIYLDGEGICCPKKATVSVYEYRKYNEDLPFVMIDKYIENYKTGRFPTFNERQDYYEGSDKIQKLTPGVSDFGIVGTTTN